MKLPTNQTEMNHFLSLASDSKDISSPDIALKLKSLFDSTVLNQAFRYFKLRYLRFPPEI